MNDGTERLAAIMKSLAHPVRLQIVEVLRTEEACVCHLEARLGQRQAYISQQLMKLRDAGLVTDRRDGMNVFYSLADETIGLLLDTAQHTAASLSEEEVTFSLPFGPEDRPCPCPKCETTAIPG